MDQLEQKHFDTSRGFRYNYYISPASQADASKPTILLCHGWPDSALLWKDVIPHILKSKQRLVVPDLLGYGSTSKPTDPKAFEISAMVNDVAELLKAEGIEGDIIPMGHDWGSFFVQRFYYLSPSPFTMAGLVTFNVALMPPQKDDFDLDAVNAATEKGIGYPMFAYWDLFADAKGHEILNTNPLSVWHAMHGDEAEWMKKLFCTTGAMRDWVSNGKTSVPLKSYAQDSKLKEHWINWVKSEGLQSAQNWYRAMAKNVHHPTENRIFEATEGGKVKKPYLFIGCDGDAVCRTDAIEGVKKAGLVEDVEVKELKSGHWCPYERPEEVGETVLAWLKKKGFAGA